MADELSSGSVPPFYREVYDIVCPNQEAKVDRDVFVKILMKSNLPKTTLSQIWVAVDNKQGFLNRNGFYKALALTALAQQGKPVNEKLLENFADQELPRPSLGDLTELKTLTVQVRKEKNPSVLGFNYKQLQEMDVVSVGLVPEKKGLLLKHVEYEVQSNFYKTTVMRRYNDFIALHEVLLQRFPYRLVPTPPPKKMMRVTREFIESRRRALRRYLTMICRHPVFHESAITKFFMTFQGSDMQHKIKEQFRGIPDEFMTSPLAAQAKDLVPIDTQVQFANSRDQIKNIFDSIYKLKTIVDNVTRRSAENSIDMLQFAKELNQMSGDSQPASAWAMGTNDGWPQIKGGLKTIAVEFAALSDKHGQQSARTDNSVGERLALLLDLLQSYKDLCERHEKGVLRDHQMALQKMANIKKKKMSATLKGGDQQQVGVVEQLESRITEQASQIMTMENRNLFSLHCLQMETQLIHANIPMISDTMQVYAQAERQGFSELLSVWQDILCKTESGAGESQNSFLVPS
ncbi:sorting nexin-8-like [Anneissia japonica]|uniref:sorting nexin-8-like n=1 Tax=Anneissia japonica TaxID=1529436 RepID=UPI001425950A|nr:sorting nexin-8-like [Anneissia japonica]